MLEEEDHSGAGAEGSRQIEGLAMQRGRYGSPERPISQRTIKGIEEKSWLGPKHVGFGRLERLARRMTVRHEKAMTAARWCLNTIHFVADLPGWMR